MVDPKDVDLTHGPVFAWLVRDFQLELIMNGHEITKTEYLESKISNIKNKDGLSRKIINQTFARRECFTLVRPVQDDRLLTKLGVSDLEEKGMIRREFTHGLHQLKDFILSSTPVKTNYKNY